MQRWMHISWMVYLQEVSALSMAIDYMLFFSFEKYISTILAWRVYYFHCCIILSTVRGLATKVSKKELVPPVDSAASAKQKPDEKHVDAAPHAGAKPPAPRADAKPATGVDSAVKVGAELPNCGVAKACAASEISVQLYTGLQNKDPPKICVNGK